MDFSNGKRNREGGACSLRPYARPHQLEDGTSESKVSVKPPVAIATILPVDLPSKAWHSQRTRRPLNGNQPQERTHYIPFDFAE